jgi:hypothetical protein
MIVRLLYFEDCPSHETTLKLARQVMDETEVEAELEIVEVCDNDQAGELRFLGSPTVQIDGRDIEPGAEARFDFAMSCRKYGASGARPTT